MIKEIYSKMLGRSVISGFSIIETVIVDGYPCVRNMHYTWNDKICAYVCDEDKRRVYNSIPMTISNVDREEVYYDRF